MIGERQLRWHRLFYAVCLEDRIPAGHVPRWIDAVPDLGLLRAALAWF